ncbi:adenine deaminase [Methanoculleus sp. FWC-SCC1]|uniref:Adenine deaminase n=1 Tax=Methanoculleus frigidifontis TaxID=2584085 RepID=A0ABT8M959_9EURY|nr:adenine deaminase [Methanoculleus sp. FWC-SCC1]MDN7024451.1 adenine deaminase [Methanoculleus sp. FWC-SCC1]
MNREGIAAARGLAPADSVYTNCEIFNPFACTWEKTGLAVKDGLVVGLGEYTGRKEVDCGGARIVPGLIDAHVHIESLLLTPAEYARLVLRHGTTTVVADPHEIANVCGSAGIEYILRESGATPLDILVMLPSCVPATPMDRGGAVLGPEDLRAFVGRDGVIGLGEMMNVPGVLAGDGEVAEKLDLCAIVDGHAPLLSGKDLNAYMYAGIDSDHECTQLPEGREKLLRGMYVMMREGSTERNLRELVPLVDACTAPRCCFATDDRHVDMLLGAGHIDDCIRKAIFYGCEPEIALRMATLSAAERFGLHDRGALAPGRIADFCILDDCETFRVARTFKRGIEVVDPGYRAPAALRRPPVARLPVPGDLAIAGEGVARVVGLVPGQIMTEDLRFAVAGASLPDTGRDILKAVVTDRYRGSGFGVGLVHGFGLLTGALASSVSHDSHNIVAVGADDGAIVRAIAEVAGLGGGMAAVSDGAVTSLPLDCAGLMSTLPYDEVARRLADLEEHARSLGAVANPFMYLSFLALTVIPHLRVTERGVFDVDAFADVPLFVP